MPTSTKTYIQLFLITLLAHGVMLFSKMLMWDSYLVVNAVQTGSFDMMKDCYYVTGRRVTIYLLEFLASLPNYIITFKVISVFIIWGIACFIYKLLNYFNFFTSTENFFISALTIAAPFYGVWFEMIAITSPFSYLVFLMACWCYILYMQQSHKVNVWLIISLLLFAISFELQSFYVFIYVFLAGFFLKEYNNDSLLIQLKNFCKKHFILLLFPVIIFVLWNHFFPIDPVFKQYNQIKFEGLATIKSLAYNYGFSFFKMFISLPLLFVKAMLGDKVGAMITIVVVGGLATISNFKFQISNSFKAKPIDKKISNIQYSIFNIQFNKTTVQILASIIILLAALFPYCLVNKPASALNYDARNAILVGLPVAMLLVALARLGKFKSEMFLKTILLLFCICSTYNYFIWNYRFEKSKQLISAFKQLPLNKMQKNILIDDQTHPIGNSYFTSYEYNYMMKQTTGKEEYCCMNTRDKMATNLSGYFKMIEPMKFHFYMKDYQFKNDSISFIKIEPIEKRLQYSQIFIKSIIGKKQDKLFNFTLK